MFNQTYATFAVGDIVTATQNTAVLREGETYTVYKITDKGEIWERVYWVLDADDEVMSVKNGHINLQHA